MVKSIFLDVSVNQGNLDLKSRLEDILNRIEFRQALGKEIVPVWDEKIDRIYFDKDGKALKYFGKWIKILEKKEEVEKLIKWILTYLNNDIDKQTFVSIIIQSDYVNESKQFINGIVKASGNNTKKKILQELSRNKSRDYIQETIELINNENNPDVITAGLDYLIAVGAVEQIEFIAGFLDNKNALLRKRAVKAIGLFEVTGYEKQIAKLLDDQKDFIKEVAIWALGRLRSDKYSKDVAKFLSHKEPKIRKATVESVKNMRAVEYKEGLVKLLHDESRPVVRMALDAFGELKLIDYESEIGKLLDNTCPEIRGEAAISLARMGSEKFAPKIAKLLEDYPDSDSDSEGTPPSVYACRALAILDAKDYIEDIASLLKSENYLIAGEAARTLAVMGVKDYLDDIVSMMESESRAKFAIEALGILGQKQYTDKIGKFLEDKWNFASAIFALGKLDAKKYTDRIAKFLDNKHPLVLIPTIKTITALNAKKYLDKIKNLTTNYDEWNCYDEFERRERIFQVRKEALIATQIIEKDQEPKK
ncbi:MAG: HEAT repeat domain-containing protein [Planctomycetes bacterium]|nr:HEAT repeat domain-containing protein [Planctomycetota bacterium]